MSAPVYEIDEPWVTAAVLSKTYDTDATRLGSDYKPKWSAVKLVKPIPCDECFARQYETKGDLYPRARAKHRRRFEGGQDLLLCSAHAMAWQDRDAADLAKLAAPKPRPRTRRS